MIDPAIMHGAPCFAGTRVPVQTLFELLERGRTIEYFLDQFPTVHRDQVNEVLRAGLAFLSHSICAGDSAPEEMNALIAEGESSGTALNGDKVLNEFRELWNSRSSE